jgi:hypothetical protein
VKVAVMTETTHNPFDEIHWASCLRENLTSSSYGEGLETSRAFAKAPRQSLTRQTFHKILKSGCRAEHSKLRTAERLVNLLATFCILSWRIFWMTMLNRFTRNLKPTLAFTALEIKLLDRLIPQPFERKSRRGSSLNSCLTQLARLGGYLNRASDAPAGNTVIWRGLSRLTDIEIGYLLGSKNVGN